MENLPNFKAILSAEWIHLPGPESLSKAAAHPLTLAENIQEVIKSFRGDLINSGVPTYLCIFPSVFEGILASIELLKRCRVKSGPSVRLAMHYGALDNSSGQLNDETTGVAVHIQSLGKTNAVVVSKSVYDQMISHPQFKARSLGKFEIHGLPGLNEIFVLMGFGLTPPSGMGWINRIKESIQNAGSVIQAIF
ncbi:MAG: hypothetical protein SH818_15295 [Saprospiraceae bacterium]|nr:hypothetical protein [Saprospiraceae bacterium]